MAVRRAECERRGRVAGYVDLFPASEPEVAAEGSQQQCQWQRPTDRTVGVAGAGKRPPVADDDPVEPPRCRVGGVDLPAHAKVEHPAQIGAVSGPNRATE